MNIVRTQERVTVTVDMTIQDTQAAILEYLKDKVSFTDCDSFTVECKVEDVWHGMDVTIINPVSHAVYCPEAKLEDLYKSNSQVKELIELVIRVINSETVPPKDEKRLLRIFLKKAGIID